MKLPNGYGSVSKLSGKRRRPFVVRIQKQILGYTMTREEGLALLADYHREPWDIEKKKATFSDVFDLMMDRRKSQVSEGTLRKYTYKYRNYCSPLYDLPYSEIKTFHFMTIIDNPDLSNNVKKGLKQLFRAMDKTAYEYDIISKMYSENIPSYQEEVKVEKQPFSEEEIKILWDKVDSVEDVDLVLFNIYTGMRSGEIEKLLIENIDLEEGMLKGGIKTKAGKNRLIPIHSKIMPIVKKRIEEAKEKGKETFLPYGSKQYRVRFKKVMQILKMSHIPHECRHTLRTRLDNLNINPNIINLILGHQGPGTGERVYTHKTTEQLKEAIEMLD